MESTDMELDSVVKKNIENFRRSVDNMEHILDNALNKISKEDLHLTDKMEYDLFMAYMLNTLYWCYLRTKGLDPNKFKVKDELTRVRQYMLNAKQAIERHTTRPSLNVKVAERFIKHNVKRTDSGKRKLEEDKSENHIPSKQLPPKK